MLGCDRIAGRTRLTPEALPQRNFSGGFCVRQNGLDGYRAADARIERAVHDPAPSTAKFP